MDVKQIEHVQFVSTLSKGRNFVRHCFAVYGNKVECCFDKDERCFDIVAGVDGALVKVGLFVYNVSGINSRW